MKSPRVLILSLALNLALAATLLAVRKNHSAPLPGRDALAPPVSVVAGHPLPPATHSPAAATNAPFDWRMIESADYGQYVANLRGVGCPERLVADIIAADVGKLYMEKIAGTWDSQLEPWANADRRAAVYRMRLAKQSTLSEEKRAFIKELLGYEWDNALYEGDAEMLEPMFGFLPPEKNRRFWSFAQKLDARQNQIREESNGILIEEDRARLKTLGEDALAELSQMLSPGELDEFTARMQYFDFNDEIHFDGVSVNGTEFRAIMQQTKILKDVLQVEMLEREQIIPDEEPARRKTEFEKQVAQLLGPQRFADYQRAQDGDFRDALDFTKEHGLTQSAAVKVFAALQSTRKQADQIENNPSLTRDQQSAALEVLKGVAANTIRSTFGANAVDYLESDTHGGNRLDRVLAPSSKAKGQP